jgi:soluble lytic murein transglycosylase-like protein
LVISTPVAIAATEDIPNSQESSLEQINTDTGCAYLDRYPDKIRPWCSTIEIAAAKYGMEPLLVAAVMLQESGGQPEVMSHSGAVGLMQVMPRDGIAATFQCINGPCFSNRPTIQELKDPVFNVDYGTRMLAGLFERTGELREALKSYGPYDVGYIYADKVLGLWSGF